MENYRSLLKPLRIGNPANCKHEALVLTDYTSDGLEIRKARALVRFAGLKSSLNTTFESIIVNGAIDALPRFSPEEPGRSSSREHSSLSPVVTNGSSAPKVVCKTQVFPPLKFWTCASEKDVQAPQCEDARWLRGCQGSCASPRPVLRS